MVSNNSRLKWSSWFTAQNRLVSWVRELVLWRFLYFRFLCFFLPFLINCSSLLQELDEDESCKEVQLILLLFLRELLSKDIDLSLMSSFARLLFWHCHLHYLPSYFNPSFRKKLKSSLKFGSSVLFTCEQRERAERPAN